MKCNTLGLITVKRTVLFLGPLKRLHNKLSMSHIPGIIIKFIEHYRIEL